MINFSKYKYIAISISVILTVVGFFITFFVHKGYAHSLDFNGGLRAVVRLDSNYSRKDLENFFVDKKIETVIILIDKEKNVFQVDIGLGDAEKIVEINKNFAASNPVVNPNTEVTITKSSLIDELITLLKRGFNLTDKSILSAEQVGAIVGGELTSTGISLMFSTLAIMTMYLSFRFQFKFALGASLALLHDLLLTLAMIGVFQIKPSVPLIAALLTLLGYSINDTIVIFDRIRENSSGKIKDKFSNIVNISINQTLGRTVNTSLATLISIIAIIIGGAVELYDFAYVLIFGIIVGTYSSVFIAAPVVEIFDDYSNRRKIIKTN